ncbi:MAG: ribosome maturation factor RimP [Gemmatimonadetes bacterium]|nr:ribosome maturation factor RimP [Gemmatimonadota bacterium]
MGVSSLEAVVEQVLGELGFELVELRRGGTSRRPVLDVRIERVDRVKVTIEDCARTSRALEAQLDGSELVSPDYTLEVSSPGVERRLRHAEDWRRFSGRRARVLAPSLGGRVEVELVGVDEQAGQEIGVVRDLKGEEQRVPLADVKEARLVLVWNN